MEYQIIRPPASLAFGDMTRKNLLEYNRWFHSVLPERLRLLSAAVQATSGYEQWTPDYSPQSLDGLGQWFSAQVETRLRTREEIESMRGKGLLEAPQEELTDRTFSLAADIGMYVSQTFLKNNPSLRWSQQFGSKRHVDYGQPILVGFNFGTFNPVCTMVTLAYAFSRKSRTGDRLREIYDKLSKNTLKEMRPPS